MVVGVLVLGMLVGLGTAVISLYYGYSVWMALWFYSSVGTWSALVSIAALRLISESDPHDQDQVED